MKFLSLDPGAINTGWALFDTSNSDFPVTNFGTTRSKEQLFNLLQEDFLYEGLNQLIVEDYIIKQSVKAGGFNHDFDKGRTLRIIGALEFFAWSHAIDFVLYQPSNKPIAYGQIGLTYVKGKKDMHHMDAVVHGFNHCLLKELLPKSKILGRFKGRDPFSNKLS